MRIRTDLRLRRVVSLPLELILPDEAGFIVVQLPRDAVLCDYCGCPVATSDEELGEYPEGYCLCDSKHVYEVVCRACAAKLRLKKFNTLEEAFDDE